MNVWNLLEMDVGVEFSVFWSDVVMVILVIVYDVVVVFNWCINCL